MAQSTRLAEPREGVAPPRACSACSLKSAHVPACADRDSPNAERSAVGFFSGDSRRAKRMSCTGEPPLSPFMCPLSALSSVLAIDRSPFSILAEANRCFVVFTHNIIGMCSSAYSSCCFIAWGSSLLHANYRGQIALFIHTLLVFHFERIHNHRVPYHGKISWKRHSYHLCYQ